MATVVTQFQLRGLTQALATIQTVQFAKMSDNTFRATLPNGVLVTIDPSECPGLSAVLARLFATTVL
jgi:hypothetical protein